MRPARVESARGEVGRCDGGDGGTLGRRSGVYGGAAEEFDEGGGIADAEGRYGCGEGMMRKIDDGMRRKAEGSAGNGGLLGRRDSRTFGVTC